VKYLLVLMVIFSTISCKKKSDSKPTSPITIEKGDDPNFSIVANTDTGFTGFNRKVEVFGISIYAVSTVEDNKLLHASNLMAQYLDNDEDGTIDNQLVLDAMKSNNAFLFLWKNESDLNKLEAPSNAEGQDLGNDETIPSWHTNGHMGRFDAALEEVLHIITHAGYATAYPTIFGENSGTALSNAMDIARGGYFETIPSPYPSSAWYSYDDPTCDYSCMLTEYFYWSLSSVLGAQENRLSDIDNEWRLNTKNLVQTKDIVIYNLLVNPEYKLPTKLPDGTYRH